MHSASATIHKFERTSAESLIFITTVGASGCNISIPLLVYLSAMIRYLSGLLVLMVSVVSASFAQTEQEYEATYAKRIKMEIIDGIYIPADLEDAFSELNRLSEPKGLAEFKSAPEENVRRRLHFGLGRWMMMNWGFEDGSRLSHHLKQKGISLPDDMVEFIIITWHRKLNNQPLRIEEEVAMIQKRMEEEKKKRDEKKVIISSEKRPHKE